MFTCKGSVAVENRKKNLYILAKDLKDLDTSPDLAEAIITGLNHAHNSTTTSAQEYGHFDFGGGITLRKIIEDQTSIGWTNFLCGRWGVKWKEAQQPLL